MDNDPSVELAKIGVGVQARAHSLREDVAARAIGADHTLVYVRTEYPLAVARMRKAVADAGAAGLLGDDARRGHRGAPSYNFV